MAYKINSQIKGIKMNEDSLCSFLILNMMNESIKPLIIKRLALNM